MEMWWLVLSTTFYLLEKKTPERDWDQTPDTFIISSTSDRFIQITMASTTLDCQIKSF